LGVCDGGHVGHEDGEEDEKKALNGKRVRSKSRRAAAVIVGSKDGRYSLRDLGHTTRVIVNNAFGPSNSLSSDFKPDKSPTIPRLILSLNWQPSHPAFGWPSSSFIHSPSLRALTTKLHTSPLPLHKVIFPRFPGNLYPLQPTRISLVAHPRLCDLTS
jgi:hypothetical protein